jgi:hypothetical protein
MEGVKWEYFFGAKRGKKFDRYYEAVINGVKVERHDCNIGRTYSIGNMDQAKVLYKTEEELIRAIIKT